MRKNFKVLCLIVVANIGLNYFASKSYAETEPEQIYFELLSIRERIFKSDHDPHVVLEHQKHLIDLYEKFFRDNKLQDVDSSNSEVRPIYVNALASNAEVENFISSYSYPNGNLMSDGKSLYYPNGMPINIENNFNYPNGDPLNLGGDFYFPNGKKVVK